MEGFLKTREAARALGVSVSTLKRWVDAGELKASRTLGKHRLIACSEALRFARERSLPTVDLNILVGVKAASVASAGGGGVPALVSALSRGRAGEARALILAAYAAGGDAAGLADSLIRPALAQIGHEWGAGTLDVFEEHRASRIVEAILFELVHRAPAPAGPEAPMAIGASPEGDLYTLPGLLAELTLRELGWQAINLGPNLPMGSLARAIRAHRPDLVWLSINHVKDPGAFLSGFAEAARAADATGSRIVAGGQALGPELRARMAGVCFGECFAQLRDLARGLHAAGAGISPDAAGPSATSHP